jgi:transposase
MSARQIARRLGVNRDTVKRIIEQGGQMPTVQRKKQQIDEELLRRLYRQCGGFARRMYEKLAEEEGIQVTYSTLTRMLRRLGISNPRKARCHSVPDEPGAEMQHDTTLCRILLAGKRVNLTASMLYLRYSKRRYLKFYRAFNRFKMKCFLHEALMFWGYAALECIIDNTNLARQPGSGTGAGARIVPEMERFAAQYGTRFRCHAIRHSNRKAGEERSFHTMNTNFLPGRTFESLEDLNRQAFEWSSERMHNRAQGKANLIPAKAFEHERAYLIELCPHIPAPCRPHVRCTDVYGYAAFAGNYYWVPGTDRQDVEILEYADRLKINLGATSLAQYPLPPDGVRNERFSPEGRPAPRYKPHNRRKPTQQEEKHLRAIHADVGAYLDFVLQPGGIRRHAFLRRLHALSRRIAPALFIAAVQRAHRYRINDIRTLERIAAMQITEGVHPLPRPQIDEDFQQRDTYVQGRLTDPPDLSAYDEEEENTEEDKS